MAFVIFTILPLIIKPVHLFPSVCVWVCWQVDYEELYRIVELMSGQSAIYANVDTKLQLL